MVGITVTRRGITPGHGSGDLPHSVVNDSRGVAAGDLLQFNGSTFVRLPKGTSGQWVVVRSDGTIQYTTPTRTSGAAWGIVADGKSGLFAYPTAASNTFPDTNSQFSTGDIGKIIAIGAAGANGDWLVTTITGYSAGTVTIGATATFGDGTRRAVFWGTDNTTALQTAVNSVGSGILEIGPGDICYQGPLDFNSLAGLSAGTNKAFCLSGAGGGFTVWAGNNSVFGAPAASRLVNFSQDEALLSAAQSGGQGVFALYLQQLGVKQVRDSTLPGTAAIYLTNVNGGGISDVLVEGSGNSPRDHFTGTFSNVSNQITGLGTAFVTSNCRSAIKVGDSLYGSAIPANTTVTAISPSTGTVTMSANASASGSATFITLSPNSGHALWVDNPAAGSNHVQRLIAQTFSAPPGSGINFGGSGLKIGSQLYTTTGITGTVGALSSGQATVTGISSFAGWFPGATITVTAGTGTITGGVVLRVNRALGTATISASATTAGTVTMTLSTATTSQNSGNMQFDACRMIDCMIGCHGQGSSVGPTGTVFNNSVFNGCKFFWSGTQFSGMTAPPQSVGVFLESQHWLHTFNSLHVESFWHGIHLAGGVNNWFNAPILSSGIYGSAASGRTAIIIDGAATGHVFNQAALNQSNWDIGVSLGSGTSGNLLTVLWTSGSTPQTTYYSWAGTRNFIRDIGVIGAVTPWSVALSGASPQSTTSGVNTAVAFATETYKFDLPGFASWHSNITNNSRITVPLTGTYRFHAQGEFAASATATRLFALRKNAAASMLTQFRAGTSSAFTTDGVIDSGPVQLTAGDYVEFVVMQDSGGALNLQNTNQPIAFTAELLFV